MIGKGAVYNKILSDAFSFHPIGTRLNLKSRTTFSEWLNSGVGSFGVPSATAKSAIIEAAGTEVSSAVLTEAAFLINHQYEHAIEIFDYKRNGSVRSDTWNVVTIYYFAFFGAQAFLRLVGRPVFQLNDSGVTSIGALAPSGSPKLGAGPYSLEHNRTISINIEEYIVKRKNSRVHDATWLTLFQYFKSVCQGLNIVTDPYEKNLYHLLLDQKLRSIYNSDSWPSSIRSTVNYKPGFSYQLLENGDIVKIKKFLRKNTTEDYDQLLRGLDDSIRKCVIGSDISNHIEVLYFVGLILLILNSMLFEDLSKAYKLQAIFKSKRNAILKKHSLQNEFEFLGP